MMARVSSAPPRPSDPRERPIGVFDSGVGGLTVLHELLVALPHEDFLYLGDTRRFPYGERTPQELSRFSAEIAEELVRRGTKLLVGACHRRGARGLRAAARGGRRHRDPRLHSLSARATDAAAHARPDGDAGQLG